MTQNDIAYYNARKEAKDARLRRKETKRHNLASEEADRLKASASYLSAQAAQSNAATNRANYELEWAKEYGYDYGGDPNRGYMLDINTSEAYTVVPTNLHYAREWKQERTDQGHIVINVPEGQYGVPQSYIVSEINIAKGMQDVRTGKSQAEKNFWSTLSDSVLKGAKTVQIIAETGIVTDKYIQRRNQDG